MASEGEIENSPTLAGEQKTGITYNSNTQNLYKKRVTIQSPSTALGNISTFLYRNKCQHKQCQREYHTKDSTKVQRIVCINGNKKYIHKNHQTR